MERYELSIERIEQCLTEATVEEPYLSYFRQVASFMLLVNRVYESVRTGEYARLPLAQLQKINHELYEDILPDRYDTSYANPTYAAQQLGEYGTELSFLYTELRGTIPDAFEQQVEFMTIYQELFIEIYNMFEAGYDEVLSVPKPENVRNALYWFVSDNCDICVMRRVKEQLVPSPTDLATQIIQKSDLSDLRYLYQFGEYVSENEIETVSFRKPGDRRGP